MVLISLFSVTLANVKFKTLYCTETSCCSAPVILTCRNCVTLRHLNKKVHVSGNIIDKYMVTSFELVSWLA